MKNFTTNSINPTNNDININTNSDDILNFLTGLDYIKTELEKIDCPDFDCNGWELLNDTALVDTLRQSIDN